jgi:hypothetical protein
VTERAARRWLWLGLFAVLPLPLLGLQSGVAPAARSLELGAVCVAVMVVESARGVAPVLAAIFLAQALLYGLALWLAARLAARALRAASPRARGAAVVAILIAGALVASSTAVYRTPFRAAGSRATLLEVYE